MKRSLILAVGVFAWCGGQALAQDAGGFKGLPGAVQKDVGNAVQQEIDSATGKAVAPAAKAGAAKDAAAATGDAAVKGADDTGAGMKGAAPAGGSEEGDDTE